MSFTFGTASNTAAPSFGGSSGFKFGATTTSNPAPAFGAPSTGFSFGNTANTANQQSTGLSFGSTTATNPLGGTTTQGTGFSFGGAGQPAAQTSGFSFGTPSSTTTNPAASSGFSFGANTTKSPLAGGFGTSGGFGTTTAQNTATSGFSFGSPATGNNSLSFGNNANMLNKPAGTNLFGSPLTSAPAFGAANSNTSAFPSFGFGNTAAKPLTNTVTTGFGAAPLQATNNSLSTRPQGPVYDAIEKLERAYAPLKDINGNYIAKSTDANNNNISCKKNEECHFKTIILSQKQSINSSNSVLQQQQQQQQQLAFRPENHHLIYGALLEEVEKDNIDPSNYIPVEEFGIDSLKQRFENQTKEINNMNDYILKLRELMKSIDETNRSIQQRISLLKMKQLPLNQKLLFILRKIEILRCHGNPLQITEKHFQNHLVEVIKEMESPRQKLEDISVNLVSWQARWKIIFLLLKFFVSFLHQTLQTHPKDLYQEEIKEDDLMILINALKKQHEGLEYLMETLRFGPFLFLFDCST
jgi:hypothetical protein